MKTVETGATAFGNDLPLTVIAGPCQLESRDHALMIARSMAEACAAVGAGYVFKGSYDKANRTSLSGKRGLGMDEGLAVLDAVKSEIGCPVLTDVHGPDQCAPVAQVCDILQIPAFLCRQTDLLLAAGETGATINVKKGQFLAPWDMANVTAKLEAFGAKRVLVTERGVSFGYNTLVSDMRALPQLAATGWPVVFDATHSVQQPGGLGGKSGGQREFVPVLARAAVAVGVAAVFIETHDDPANALSDGPNMVPLDKLGQLLEDLMAFDRLAKSRPLTEL
jgi:2-dehydro-3-deoxyphosphooctonate aldolase (KDO 8-P synthase)